MRSIACDVWCVRCGEQQIKKLARPEFEANPEKFYPTKTLTRLGYSRAKCACGHFYWYVRLCSRAARRTASSACCALL